MNNWIHKVNKEEVIFNPVYNIEDYYNSGKIENKSYLYEEGDVVLITSCLDYPGVKRGIGVIKSTITSDKGRFKCDVYAYGTMPFRIFGCIDQLCDVKRKATDEEIEEYKSIFRKFNLKFYKCN